MTGKVDIANMALSHIRAGRINSFEESSAQAEQCRLFYDICRDQCLEDAPWGFATRLEPLALLDPDDFSIFNWRYCYAKPADCLLIQRLVLNFTTVSQDSSAVVSRFDDCNFLQPDLNRQVQYEVFDIDDTEVIAANDPDLRIKFNVKVTDVNKFSSSFKLGLSHLLAAHLAVSLAGVEKGQALRKDSLTLYRSLINDAVARDLNERYTPVPDSEFITIRS